jgi:hypothetical protein
LGYFRAAGDFVYAERIAGYGSDCLDDDASLDTVIRIYIAYMVKNPKQMDRPMFYGAKLALNESYPCLKPKPVTKP